MEGAILAKVKAIDGLELRDHQIEALKVAQGYLDAFAGKKTAKSALIQMPTGAGKSGVIALLANFGVSTGAILVLTPRKSLRSQLARDISGRFFRHAGAPDAQVASVMEVLEGETLEGFTPTDGTVLALTMQMLASIRASRADVYAELKRAVSLILVDEGHYEPALEWSQAIRELGAPTFVFTATPYRNDFKSFNVDAQHMSVLSYDQCVTDRLLRSVEFKSIDSAESPDEFVARLVVEIDRLRPRLPDDFRVVVRCKDANSIRGVCRALSTQTTDGVVGIHERFSDKPESWERRHVPDCAKETAVYWVHQHKLLEGIDDDRFHVVAIHGALGSARALVQQVGRVVRNPGLKESVAYVLDGSGGSHILMWDRFLAYDSAASSVERVIDIMNASENFVSSLAAATPAHVYSEGRFRTGLNLDQFDPTLDLQVPLTATWLEKKPSFDLDQFADCLVKEFRAKDHEAHAYGMDGWRVVMAYGASNSALLANQVFLEPRLRAVIIREYDSLVAAQGADAVLITHADKLGVGDPIGTSRLERLFDVSARLTSVSLSNSNLSPVSIRSRTLSASSIGETLAGFDDYSQICTRAEGYAASNRKRNNRAWKYVGFSRGRVSERSTYLPFGEYLDWLDSIASTLDSATASVPVFKRYAPGTGVPTKTDAQSLLLDMSSIGLDFVLSVDGETPLELTDTCLAVKSGKFELKANGESVEGTIAFDTARSKYRIDSPALASKYVTKSSDGIDNLVDRVNAEQSLQVLPVSPDRFYAYGSFFDPRIKIGSRYDKNSDPVTFCLHPVTNLENYAEEKGKSDYWDDGQKSTWAPDSLFRLIATKGQGTDLEDILDTATLIVCDDLGMEAADFIVCREGSDPWIALIHAKGGGKKKTVGCAASELHVVCAQATKNLGYLSPYGDEEPAKVANWGDPWDAGSGMVVTSRVVVGDGTPSEIWRRMRSVINNPFARKEVWVLVSNAISKSYFEKEMAKTRLRIKPNVYQAAVLLKGAISDASAVGAQLRVICNK